MHRALPGILIGGVAGSVVRWAIGEIGWSASTTLLAVNSLGCAVLGALAARWPAADDHARLIAGLGFCGGLTTFSGLAVEMAAALDESASGDAAGLLVASFAAGLAAFVAGRRAATR